jgi:hypothetical protein
MPIAPAAFTAPFPHRARRGRLPAGIAWLCRIGRTPHLPRPTDEVAHSSGGHVAAGIGLRREGGRWRASAPAPTLTAGGASRAMDVAFSPQGFASEWLGLRP